MPRLLFVVECVTGWKLLLRPFSWHDYPRRLMFLERSTMQFPFFSLSFPPGYEVPMSRLPSDTTVEQSCLGGRRRVIHPQGRIVLVTVVPPFSWSSEIKIALAQTAREGKFHQIPNVFQQQSNQFVKLAGRTEPSQIEVVPSGRPTQVTSFPLRFCQEWPDPCRPKERARLCSTFSKWPCGLTLYTALSQSGQS